MIYLKNKRLLLSIMTVFLLTSSCEEDKKQNEFGGVSLKFNYTSSDENDTNKDVEDKKVIIKSSSKEIEQKGDRDRQRDFKLIIPDLDSEDLSDSKQKINDVNAARITIGELAPVTLDLSSQTSYSRTGLSVGSVFINVELLDNTVSGLPLYGQGKTVSIIEDQTTAALFNFWTPLNQAMSWNSSQNSQYEIGETISLAWTNTHSETPVSVQLIRNDTSQLIKTLENSVIGDSFDWDTSSEEPRSNIGFLVSSTIINGVNTSMCCINLVDGNAAPIANDINQNPSDEDTVVTISLDGSDEDGDDLVYNINSNPSNGTLNTISGNQVDYTPNQNWNGTDSFTYSANDGSSNSNIATVTLTVNAINDPPTTVDVTAEMDENLSSARVIGITLDGNDVDGDNITYSIVSNPSNGVLGAISGNQVEYTPNQDWNGVDTFTYKANDSELDSNISTGTITVNAVNDQPEVPSGPNFIEQVFLDFTVDTNASPIENTVNLNIGENYYLEISGTATYSPINRVDAAYYFQDESGAQITPNEWNSWQWNGSDIGRPTPNGYQGDSSDNPHTYYYYFTANSENQTFAFDDGSNYGDNGGGFIIDIYKNGSSETTLSTNEDTPIDIDLSQYTNDVDGDNLTYFIVTDVLNGITSLNGSIVTYLPTLNFNGSDTFIWKVNDGSIDSNNSTIVISVNPVNDAPVSNDLNLNTAKNIPLTITFEASDVESDNLIFSKTSNPLHGTLSACSPCTGNQVIYTPNSSYFGSDSFTYIANDGIADSNPATVELTINKGAVETTLTSTNINYGDFAILNFDTDFSQSFQKLLFKIYKLASDGTSDELVVANYNTAEGPVNNTVGTNTAIVTDFYIPMSGLVFENNTGSYTDYRIESIVTKDCNGSSGCDTQIVDNDTIRVNGIAENIVIDKSNGAGDYATWDRVPLTFTSGSISATKINLIGTAIGDVDEQIVSSGSTPKTLNFDLNDSNSAFDVEQDYYFKVVDHNKILEYNTALTERGFSTNWYLYNVLEATTSGVGANGGDFRFFEHDTMHVEINEAEINFTAPIAGTVISPGTSYDFTWNSKGIPNADVRVVLKGQEIITPNDGSESIIFYTSDMFVEPGDNISSTALDLAAINIYSTNPDYNNGNAVPLGNTNNRNVTIDATNVSDPIVTYPNGGETLYFDRDITFEWDFDFIADSVFIAISSGDWQTPEYVKVVENTGTHTMQIPSDDEDTANGLADGNYYVQISSSTRGPLIGNPSSSSWPWFSDASDATFSLEKNKKPILDYSVQTVIKGNETRIPINVSDEDNDELTFTIVQSPIYGDISFEKDQSDGKYYWRYYQNKTFTSSRGPDNFTFYANDGKENSETKTAYVNILCRNCGSSNELRVWSPVDGADLVPGDNIRFQWSNWSSNIDITLIRLADESGNSVESINIANEYYQIYPESGELDSNYYYYDWTIPTNMFDNFSETSFRVNIGSSVTSKLGGTNGPSVSTGGSMSIETTINTIPVISDISVTTDEDQSLSIQLTASDADNHTLTYSLHTDATNGTISISGSTATYTPTANWSGTDTFKFYVDDGTSTVVGTGIITVNSINDAPTTNDISRTINENRTSRLTGIQLDGNDIEGDALTYSVVTGPSNGTMTINNNILNYTANQDWNGIETITYKANDGELDSNISTITITVNAVDDPIVIIGSGDSSTAASLYFDGNNDKVDFDINFNVYDVNSNQSSVNTPTSQFGLGHVTVSYWINIDAGDWNDMQIFGDIAGNNSFGEDMVFQMVLFNDALKANFRGSDFEQIVYKHNFNPNEWYHIVWVNEHGMDGTSQGGSGSGQQDNLNQGHRLYINGSFVGSHYHSGAQMLPDTGMRIGSEADSDNGSKDFKGHLDGFAIWDAEIGPNAIQEIFNEGRQQDLRNNLSHYVSSGDLHLFYTFDEFNNLALNQVGGTGQNGVITGATWGSGVSNTFTTDEDIPISIDLSQYIIDVDEDILTYFISQEPSSGSVNINGSIATYSPNLNFSGEDSFSWNVNDGTSNAIESRIDITVNNVANDPTANNITISNGTVNTAVNITLDGQDEVGSSNPLTYTIVDAPTRGSISGIDSSAEESKSATYTPNANMIGVDSFTYKVNNGIGDSNIATVLIGISNNQPSFNNFSFSSDEDVTYNYTLPSNDSDGDSVTYTLTSDANSNNGSAVINGNIFTYLPAKDWNGSGEIFKVKPNDRILDGSTFDVNVTVNPVNDVPSVRNPEYGAIEDNNWGPISGSGLLDGLGYDVDGQALSGFNIIVPFQNGSIPNNGNGYIYVPNYNFYGADSLIYNVYNSSGTSEEGVWKMIVNAQNDAPTANNVNVTLRKNVPLTVNLFSENPNIAGGKNYVYDVDNDDSELSFIDAGTVNQYSEASILVDSSGLLTITPVKDFVSNNTGTVKLGYSQVSDGELNSIVTPGGSNTTGQGYVIFNVFNDVPTVSDLAVTTNEDFIVSITLPTAEDINGDDLTYFIDDSGSGENSVQNGTLGTLNGNIILYTPNTDWSGTDSFQYYVSDGTSNSDNATVTITVNPVNDAPTTNDISTSTNEETTLDITLDGNDIDNDNLSYVIVSDVQNGTTSLNGNILTYTPSIDFDGNDSFTYKANDGTEDSNVSTVSIVVNEAGDEFVKYFELSSSNTLTNIRQIVPTDDNGSIIVGTAKSSGGSNRVYVLKLDANSNKEIDGYFTVSGLDEAQGMSIDETSDGGYAIAGYGEDGSDIQAFVMKINSSLQLEWSEVFGNDNSSATGNDDRFYSVQAQDNGDIRAVGRTNSWVSNLANDDILVANLSSSGSSSWPYWIRAANTKFSTTSVSGTPGSSGTEYSNGSNAIDGSYFVGTYLQSGSQAGGIWSIEDVGTNIKGQFSRSLTENGLDIAQSVVGSIAGGFSGGYAAASSQSPGGVSNWSWTYTDIESVTGFVHLNSFNDGYVLVGENQDSAQPQIGAIKIDDSGNQEWLSTFSTDNAAYDYGRFVAETYDGYLFVLGETKDQTTNNKRIVLLKINSIGESERF